MKLSLELRYICFRPGSCSIAVYQTGIWLYAMGGAHRSKYLIDKYVSDLQLREFTLLPVYVTYFSCDTIAYKFLFCYWLPLSLTGGHKSTKENKVITPQLVN